MAAAHINLTCKPEGRQFSPPSLLFLHNARRQTSRHQTITTTITTTPPTTFSMAQHAKRPLAFSSEGLYWAQADLGGHFMAFHTARLPITHVQCDCRKGDFAKEASYDINLDLFEPLLFPLPCPSTKRPASGAGNIPIFTLIVPRTAGYITRSDFFQIRLQDFAHPHIVATLECTQALTLYRNRLIPGHGRERVILTAPFIIRWDDFNNVSTSAMQEHFASISTQLRRRLNNVPWLGQWPIPRKRVALVRGRPNITAGGPIYRAAEALGIDLVIVDDAGHWLELSTKDNLKHREAFLATDMTEDEGVVDRIIASIRAYPLPIHGVFTLSDNFFVTVAKVAQELGLPTNPVSAFETAVDKYRSRLLQDSPGQTARVTSVQELEALLEAPQNGDQPCFSPSFPMIVKPTKGWSSECVSKVSKLEDLATAVEKATRRHGSAAVIEPFFDGPEIDANFILIDGEVAFCEIADEPPCSADDPNATVDDTFSPVALTLPSALPEEEQRKACDVLSNILIKLGFRTGIVHVEARMTNSSWEYRDVGDGIIDLAPKDGPPSLDNIFTGPRLLEINARPPGYRVTLPSKCTYGVDYFAAHILAALGDTERLRMVATPFGEVVEGIGHGAQYHSRLVYVPAPAAGIVRWKSPELSPCEDLMRRRPDLAAHISINTDYFQPGDKITTFTDGARTYVAHLLVRSVNSRREAIEIGNEVLKSFEICIEDHEEYVTSEEEIPDEMAEVIDEVIEDAREKMMGLEVIDEKEGLCR
ncbi:hypothetical protein B0H67DRAFT_512537 [Lasiosphaeris hirsuta]|uniref:ATP-grasp domain-containing protein n=1 Tax=Lasiosphaeris hirsuta TaxID=260670 RepID=A0AA40DZ18_9PEZI|nr:hypothetical protein B0H67DRAFT_512537 [Lasiosphaeris hirsuta]